MKNKKAFTLVELIVVVTILAILSTVGFVAFSGYLEGVRDTNRVSQLKNINDGLSLYQATSQLPLPDDYVEVKSGSGRIIGYQGYAGENILSKIEYSAEGKDPKDGSLFTYAISKERKNFNLMTFLEEENGLEGLALTTPTYASYENRYPYVDGRKVGILLDDVNTPVQENTTIQSQGYIDILDLGTDRYQMYLTNSEMYAGSGAQLRSLSTNYDCKRLKDMKGSLLSGVYPIDPDGDGVTTSVYCDMDTDGGGWTFATMLADRDTINLFEENPTNNPNHAEFITDIKSNISTKGKLSNVWTDDKNRDLLLQCFSTEPEHQKYKIPFLIYDFLGTEKINLTKNNKSGEEFSSMNLKAKWKNIDFTLHTTYKAASHPERMTIADTNGKGVFFIKEHQLVADEYGNTSSPAYDPVGRYKDLSESIYCVTAIR